MEARSAPILCRGRLMIPTLMNLSDDEIVRIWDGVSQYILRQLALNKGVTIPGLGTFCLIKHYLSTGASDLLHTLKPIFQLSENFAWVHGLQYEKETLPGALSIVLLNYTSVSLDTRIPRDTVQRCVQETLLFLSYTLAKKQDVDFTFKDMGCLRFRKNKVKMQFSADFVCSLDSTGRLLKSLLSRSSTRGSAVSGRKDAPSQSASGDIVVFPKWVDSQCGPRASDCPFPAQPTASISQKVAPSPATLGGGTLDSDCRCRLASRIGLYVALGRAAGEGALQSPKGQAEKKKKGEARREEEAKRTGPLTEKRQLLSRERLSPARLPRVTVEGDLGEAAGAKEPSLRLPAVREESSSRKGDGKSKRSAAARPQTQPPVCEGHRRAGQEVCYLCMQRDERNLRASLAEERLQKEREEERMWAEYQARRERNEAERGRLKTQADKRKLLEDGASSLRLVELARKGKAGENTASSVPLTPGGRLSVGGGGPGAQVAPVEWKQQQLLIPRPPEKAAETAAPDESLSKCRPVRGIRVRRLLEKRREAP
ncbi:coiled-coil domain-containing protein 81-like [Haliaeetus albicilla]|uniref:coiled-coil domain-containing protein 81-like n=1 Tax=Haliaeetus albicilla TaxID=8969 RepID=UPI0037E87D44